MAYFHACVAARRKKNRISRIQKTQGGWCESDEEISNFYKTLFTSSLPNDFKEILNGIPRTITS